MNLRKQFLLLIGIFSLLFLILGVSVIYTNIEISRIENQEELSRDILLAVYQLSYLSNDYFMHPNENRQNIQWDTRFNTLSQEIGTLEVRSQDKKILASRIIDNLKKLKDLYTESVEAIDANKISGKLRDSDLIQISWSRSIVQFNDIIFDVSHLSKLLNNESHRLHFLNTTLTMLLMGTFFLILIISYQFFTRQILSSISDLSQGIRIIGAGNLKYQIRKGNNDEIGELVDDFNQMAVNLQNFTISIERLENEITERELLQASLGHSEERFRNLFEIMKSGCVIYAPVNGGEDFVITEFNKEAERIEHISREDIIGKRVTEVFPGVKEFGILNVFTRVFLTGTPEYFPEGFYHDYQNPGGWRENWIYKISSGEIVAIYNDISDKKKAEEDLQLLYQDLESQVKNRTIQLKESNQILEEEIVQRSIAEETLLQTLSLLNATLNSTEEGLLVIDNSGSITKFNRQFIQMWNIPESIIKERDKTPVVGYIMSRVKNPEPFIYKIQEIYDTSDSSDFDVIELQDDQIFEWYSKPQKIENDVIGRVWSFHDVTVRVQMEHQIEKSLREKEMLLKEVHHRVKNNMQVISSLLYMQERKIQNEQAKEILRESQNRIKSIALVHEKIYQSKDLEHINYNDYIRMITRNVCNSYLLDPRSVTLMISSETVFLSINKAVPCSLILNELISNSLKYAFPDQRKGTITINFQIHSDSYVLDFKDDGVGFAEGIRFDNSDTLGFELMKGLIHQLNGTIELDQGSGTAYTIRFPVDNTDTC